MPGVITSSGGGSNSKNITGQISAGSSALGDSKISGSVTIGYDSCKLKQALPGQAFKISSWKQTAKIASMAVLYTARPVNLIGYLTDLRQSDGLNNDFGDRLHRMI